MVEERIKEIVASTIDETLAQKYCRNEPALQYEYMGKCLKSYYADGKNYKIREALEEIKNDRYYKVLELFYRDNMTLTAIATILSYDRTTISRKKKRLVMWLYKRVFEEKEG